MSTVPPIRREILVDADPAVAFEVFTAGIGRWWPMEEHSVHGKGGAVAFEDGRLVERRSAGRPWGTVTRWEPPATVAFTWHPRRPNGPLRRGHVRRRGQDAARRSTGWDAFDDPAAARAEYDHGWPLVLGRYQEHVGEAGDTWVALLHRPGPAAPVSGSLFSDPRFGQHVAFLNRMHEAGYLVAAGPLTDAAGEGMTILRLPGAGQLGEATRLATEDDASVAGGFLAVTVRPWQVMMTAGS